jgi:glycosyltransferase involved in cell wall biosynthesis
VWVNVGLKAVLRLFGKGDKKVAAVFGISPKPCHEAVAHLKSGAPEVPVWLFAVTPPLPETEALCERVFVSRSSVALFFQAQARLWPCWVAIAAGTWTAEHGRWLVKLAPFFVPPFRTLFLNSWGGFFPGRPELVALHWFRFMRGSAISGWIFTKEIAQWLWLVVSYHIWRSTPVRRTQEIAAGCWALVSYHVWRSGPVRRIKDVGYGFWRLISFHMWRSSAVRRVGDLASGVSISILATGLRWLGYPHRTWFRKLHGNRELEVADADAGTGTGIDCFVQKGPSWNFRELTELARTSQARWILWRQEGAPDSPDSLIDDMLPLFADSRTFAVARQTQARGWKAAMLPMAPFRQLQPGTASQVLAPVAPEILVDRAKLAALGIPEAGLTHTAWMLAFWKAAAAGWRSYSVPGGEAEGWQPEFPEPEAEFFLRALNEPELRSLGACEPELSRGNIAFAPRLQQSLGEQKPQRGDRLKVVLVSPFLPYPLSHGGAVRIFNLCRELADQVDFILIAIREAHDVVDFDKLHEVFRQVYTVDLDEHASSNARLPKQVRAAESSSLRALIGEVCRREQPDLLQIEFTHMAGYRDAAPDVPAILVEHDLTFDLYCQLAESNPSKEAWDEYQRWLEFERHWLAIYDGIWTVSEEDRQRATMGGGDAERTFVVPNGVDVRRFTPLSENTDAPELFYVGSFRHLPNILAFQKLCQEVMPRVWARIPNARLGVVAGPRHEFFWDTFAKGVPLDADERVQLHGFVEDLRPLYARAGVVVAPLEVSAGTNIKVLEAMACGKVVVSTPVGCAGLELRDGEEAFIREDWAGFAEAVCAVLSDAELRGRMGEAARWKAEERFSWSSIADRAYESYRALRQPVEQERAQKRA